MFGAFCRQLSGCICMYSCPIWCCHGQDLSDQGAVIVSRFCASCSLAAAVVLTVFVPLLLPSRGARDPCGLRMLPAIPRGSSAPFCRGPPRFCSGQLLGSSLGGGGMGSPFGCWPPLLARSLLPPSGLCWGPSLFKIKYYLVLPCFAKPSQRPGVE